MSLAETVGYVIGSAGAIGFAGVALYTGRAKAVITLQQDEITALREANTRLQAESHQYQFSAAANEAEVKRLQNMVQSVPAFEKMSVQMAKQHAEVITTLGHVATELAKVAQSIASSANDSNRREASLNRREGKQNAR